MVWEDAETSLSVGRRLKNFSSLVLHCLLVPFIAGKSGTLDPIDTGFLGRARKKTQSYCLMDAIEDSDFGYSFVIFSLYT